MNEFSNQLFLRTRFPA